MQHKLEMQMKQEQMKLEQQHQLLLAEEKRRFEQQQVVPNKQTNKQTNYDVSFLKKHVLLFCRKNVDVQKKMLKLLLLRNWRRKNTKCK
jgi:hypothetical protein